MLSRLEEYCNTWALRINVDKTKLVVFRKSLRRQTETIYLNGKALDELPSFNYLGTQQNYNGRWGPAMDRAILQGRKATFMLEQKFCKWDFRLDEKMELFSKLSIPVVLYGSELWGGGDLSKITKFQRE